MKTKKTPRWSGRPEVWVDKKLRIILRTSEHHAELLDDENPGQWKFIAFKRPFSFDFFNGSKHLMAHGFQLIERL